MTQTIRERNNQYRNQMRSNDVVNTRNQRDRLINFRKKMMNPACPKSDKELYLGEIRKLEKSLGLPSVSYNSNEF